MICYQASCLESRRCAHRCLRRCCCFMLMCNADHELPYRPSTRKHVTRFVGGKETSPFLPLVRPRDIRQPRAKPPLSPPSYCVSAHPPSLPLLLKPLASSPNPNRPHGTLPGVTHRYWVLFFIDPPFLVSSAQLILSLPMCRSRAAAPCRGYTVRATAAAAAFFCWRCRRSGLVGVVRV